MSKYCGWTNYETWCVNLWMSNDEGQYWFGVAQELVNQHGDADGACYDLAGRLQSEVEGEVPITSGMWGDLLMASVQAVNWREIAEALLEGMEAEGDEPSAPAGWDRVEGGV